MTGRRAVTTLLVRCSNVMPRADLFRVRRLGSISAIIPVDVAMDWCIGVLERSCNPRLPHLMSVDLAGIRMDGRYPSRRRHGDRTSSSFDSEWGITGCVRRPVEMRLFSRQSAVERLRIYLGCIGA